MPGARTGVGHGTRDVIIRDPVVVTASLPRFLAPGDQASLRLDIANTDAPAGDYQVALKANDALSLDPQRATQTVRLAVGAKQSLTLPIIGRQPAMARSRSRLPAVGFHR